MRREGCTSKRGSRNTNYIQPLPQGEEEACGSGCVNRSTYTECDPELCKNGTSCTNMAVQRRTYAPGLERWDIAASSCYHLYHGYSLLLPILLLLELLALLLLELLALLLLELLAFLLLELQVHDCQERLGSEGQAECQQGGLHTGVHGGGDRS